MGRRVAAIFDSTWGKPAIGGPRFEDWMDKFHRFNVRCEFDGRKCSIMPSGVTQMGPHRYGDDGLVYLKHRKTPIGRYLRSEYCDGNRVALNCGRLADVHSLERKRWAILSRIKDKLLPELQRRSDVIRRYARRIGLKKFPASIAGRIMIVDVLDRPMGIGIANSNEENLGTLDRLALITTDEADKIAAALRRIQERLSRAWVTASLMESVLHKALTLKLEEKKNKTQLYEATLVEVKVNGRVFPVWIGPFSPTRDAQTKFWSCPTNELVDLDAELAAIPG
jgi:hypothetical protein